MKSRVKELASIFVALIVGLLLAGVAHAATDKPNILVIWGDDVGWSNVSSYNMSMMGYRTPKVGYPFHSGNPNMLWSAMALVDRAERSNDRVRGRLPRPVGAGDRTACSGCASCAG